MNRPTGEPDIWVGKQLGGYQIQRLVRDTPSGRVYLAHHPSTQLDVEIKIIPEEYHLDEGLQRRIKREIDTLTKINHTNIIRIWAIGRERDVSYLVMEHVEGRTLGDWLDQLGKLRVQDSLRLFAHILDGLAAAHRHTIIHRDIHPRNIILGNDGRIVMAEFGLAKYLGVEATSTTTYHSSEIATNVYKSPEQLANAPIDQRSDIYSVGMCLYRCIAGCLPFDGSEMEQIMARLREPAIALSRRVPDISKAVEAVIMKFLEHDPPNRYPDASAALEAIRTVAE